MKGAKALQARWRLKPWSEVHSELLARVERHWRAYYELQRVQHEATGVGRLTPEQMSSIQPELFPLLEGLPYRDEVPSGRDLRGSGFIGGFGLDLRDADLSYVKPASGMRFWSCDLTNARFVGARELDDFYGDHTGIAFTRASFERKAYVSGAMRSCNFDHARLHGIHFIDVDLAGSSFIGANLTNADLCRANLKGCNFRGACLVGALICGAAVDEATDFRGADLTDLTWDTWYDKSGNVYMAAAELARARTDSTTIRKDDPTAYDRAWLGQIIKDIRGVKAPWARDVEREAQACLTRLSSGQSFDWVGSLFSSLPASLHPELEYMVRKAGQYT